MADAAPQSSTSARFAAFAGELPMVLGVQALDRDAPCQRLAVMPDVAEWKRSHEKPVRDRPRELVILAQ